MKIYTIGIIIGFLILSFITGFSSHVAAQEEQTDQSEDTQKQEEEIQDVQTSEEDAIKKKILDLKDRLATRVAEIQEQNKRAFFGIIKEKSNGKITLVNNENEQIVALDPDVSVAKISTKGTQTDDSIDALELGEQVTVFGTLDLDQKTLVTDNAIIQELPKKIFGTVKEVDNNEGTFTVDGNTGVTVLDYEIGTRCTVFANDKRDTCGLSKIEPGDTVYVRMIPVDDNLTQATALRVLLIPKSSPEPTVTTAPQESL